MIILRFLWALVRFLKSGCKKVSAEVHQKRLFICYACAFYKPDTTRCGWCGCFVWLKAWCASEDCPVHKWGWTPIKEIKTMTALRDVEEGDAVYHGRDVE